MASVFKARINHQVRRPCNFKGVAALKVLTELGPNNFRRRVQRHQPSFLIVLPSQILKYIRFLKEYDVCGNNKDESTS